MGDDTALFTVMDWREPAAAEYRAKRQRLVERADAHRRRVEQAQKELNATESEIDDLDRGAKAFGLIPAEVKSAGPGQTTAAPKAAGRPGTGHQFKDVALEIMKQRYPQPVRTGDLQASVEAKLGRTFHYKTAGMTLYRFKDDGLVRREGRDWYWVPDTIPPAHQAQEAAPMSE